MAPRVGTEVPALEGLSTAGTPLSVGYKGEHRPTLLFVFSTQCPICTVNWPTWESLAQGIDPSRYRVVYVNLSHSLTPEYLALHHLLGSLVIAELDPKARFAYNLNLTPTVVLVAPAGRIQKVWLGMSKGNDLLDLKGTLGIGPASGVVSGS